MQGQRKELECIVQLIGIEDTISEFGEMGILERPKSENHNCSSCDYLRLFSFGKNASSCYCTNPKIINLYRNIMDKPFQHIDLDNLLKQDKRVGELLNKIALNETQGEEYQKTKQKFLEIASKLCVEGTKPELIRGLIHLYNNIILTKEVAPKILSSNLTNQKTIL
jgi:hypothetical protein